MTAVRRPFFMPLSPARTVDVRGPRPTAWVTGAVLALVSAVGAAGYLLGAPVLGVVATGFVLVAALLGAATASCPGREPYPTVRRARPAPTA
ncbi:DUF4395 family protein [Geodermatophilus sp. SYSU D00698]